MGIGYEPRFTRPAAVQAAPKLATSRLLPETFKVAPESAALVISAAAEAAGLTVDKVPVDDGTRWPERPGFFEDIDNLEGVVGPNSAVSVPYTVYPETLLDSPDSKPSVSMVAKLEGASFGQHKHLLNNDRRFSTFMSWFADNISEQGGNWLLQEHIASPVGRPVSIRVLADCQGDIVGSQLMHGIPHNYDRDDLAQLQRRSMAGSRRADKEDPRALLTDPNSKYYLAPVPVASNRVILTEDGYRRWNEEASGYTTSASLVGGSAVLDPQPISHPYSTAERKMLRKLGLTNGAVHAGTLPTELVQNASAIAQRLTRDEKGRIKTLYVGVDYVPGKDGNYYFLEANRSPSMITVRDLFGGVEVVRERDAFKWLIGTVVKKLAAAGEEASILVAKS